MATQVTHNNDGHFYTIDVDLAKEGAEVFDLTTYFKARVADNKVGLRFRWFWQGQIFNTVGKKPRVVGLVGQYSFKKNDDGTNRELVMSPDASAVAFTGDVNDCEPGGYATYYFPEQMFPQDGMFKGTVGLLDDSGETARYTSVDIWFKVYPQAGGAQMGRACDFYISDLDTALANAKEKMRQQSENFDVALQNALQELREKYQAEVKSNEDMSAETRASLSKFADTVGAIQAQIDAGNVVTRKDFVQSIDKVNGSIDKVSKEIANRLAKMDNGVHAFATAQAIKDKYPTGADGIFVAVDTGHQWYWIDGAWVDAGVYQSEGNTEVEAARKWAKIFGSTTSDSLAESIQGQDLEVLKTIFSKIEEPDISAPISDSTGYYVDYLSGEIKTYTPNGGSTAVASVGLEPGALYVVMSGLTFHPENHTEIGNGYAFYDENGVYIEGQRQLNSIERAVIPSRARTLKITTTGNASVTVFSGLNCVDESLTVKGKIPDAQRVGNGIKSALDGSDTPITTFQWSDGYFVDGQNGVLTPNQSYSYTDLTPVYGLNQLYIRSKSRVNMAFFDDAQKFVSGVDVNSTLGIFAKKIKIPEDAVYARFSVNTSTKNSLKVQFKPDYPTLNRGVGGHEDIDFGSLTPGNHLGQSGELVSNANYSYSDAFFMKPSQPVWLSAKSRFFLCEYDENGELVGYHDINYQYQQLITTTDKTVFARLAIRTDMSSELRITYDIEGREYHVGEGEKYAKILDAIEEATRYMSSKVYVHQGTYDLIDEFGADFFSGYSSSSPVGIVLKNKVHVTFENAKVSFMYDGSNQAVIDRFSPFNSSTFGFTLENLDIECQNCRYAVHDERGGSIDSYCSTYKNCHIVNHGAGEFKHYCIGAGLGRNAIFTVKNCILGGYGLLVHNDNSTDDTLAKSRIIVSGNYFEDGAEIDLQHAGGGVGLTEAVVSANSLANSDSLKLQQNPLVYVHDNIKLYAFANESRTEGESSSGKDASTSTSVGASESDNTATSQA